MPEEQSKQQQENKSGGQQQQQKGGGGQQQQRNKKPLLDPTNVVGGMLWSISAIFTSTALAVLFAPPMPSVCDVSSTDNPQCSSYAISMVVLFVIATALQAAISIGIRRLKNPFYIKWTNYLNYGLNLVGVYYIFVVKVGIMSDLRTVVSAIGANPHFPTIAISAFVLFLISVSLEDVANAFFNAPKS